MRVKLSYPHDGHKIGEEIEVDDRIGSNLVYSGRARRVEAKRKRRTPEVAPDEQPEPSPLGEPARASTPATADNPQEDRS